MSHARESHREVILKSYIGIGREVTPEHFKIHEVKERKELGEGEIRVRTKYLSVDPYMRCKLDSGEKSHFAAFELGKPLKGAGCGRVIESKNKNFKVGDIITSHTNLNWPWCEEVVFTEDQSSKYMKINDIPESFVPHTIGQLGMPGLTAYFGMLDIGAPKEGETCVVSGGAGACGSIAGQIAKLKGCKVIGISSTDKKLDHMHRCLGFDHVISYRGKTSNQIYYELQTLVHNHGVDIYYDNVGGDISNAVLRLMNQNGRVPICGQISQYNKEGSEPLPAIVEEHLKEKNVNRRWFSVYEYKDRFADGYHELFNWAKNGQIKIHQTEYEGIENLPKSLNDIFKGKNIGKMVVKISD